MAQLKHILYVEDDPDIQAVAKMALEALGGFEVEAYSSGQDALTECGSITPDFILLDVMMPGMDGPATLQALRNKPEWQAVPVAFMTALAQPEDVQALLALGAVGVIAKPFDPVMLADQVLNLWRAHIS